MRLRQFAAKLLSLARRGTSERALAKEMATHLAMMEADLRRQGLSEEEARFAARRTFGGMEQAKEQYRYQRGFVPLEQFWQDLRHAGRSLRKSPGFSAVAVLSLALGIGVNTAIFTLVNGILLKQLPIPEAARVVQLEARGKTWTSSGLSYPQFAELRRQTSILSDATGFNTYRAVLEVGNNQQQADLELVTGNYFAFFHAAPVLGRLLEEEDDRVEGAHPVCVLSYAAWQSRLGGDMHVLGRVIRINSRPVQIVGVAGPDFTGAELQKRFDLWLPTAMMQPLTRNPRSNPHMVWLSALAKLRPGMTIQQARTRLRAASKGINEVLPKDRANADAVFDCIEASKGFDTFRTRLRQPLTIVMGAVALVLLIACANLTNLLLARGMERTQEFAIKLSLGVSRWRLLRQLLIESLLLTLAGGAVAVAAARELIAILLALFNAGENWQVSNVSMDPAVLGFTFAVCAFTTIFVFVSSRHFSTMRIPLFRGRDFSRWDRKGAPAVAIVNQHLASLLWPGQDPVGKQILGGWNQENPQVIGVVGDSKYSNVRESMKPIVYEPLDQLGTMGASLEVRSRLRLADIEQQIRRIVRSDAPDFQVTNVSTMEVLRDHVIAQDRLLTFLSVLFGILGAALALVGIYGLISYSAKRRTREIGIRMSVGAQRREVLLLFLREVLLLIGLGAVIGLPLALLASKPLASFLYEVPAVDPFGFAITFLSITIGGLAASFLPARRATQVDPVEALRYE